MGIGHCFFTALPWNTEVFSPMNERDANRQNAREPLGAHVRSFEHTDQI